MGETLKAAARAAGEREAGEIMVVGDASPSTADLHVGVGGVGDGGRAGEANGPQKMGVLCSPGCSHRPTHAALPPAAELSLLRTPFDSAGPAVRSAAGRLTRRN